MRIDASSVAQKRAPVKAITLRGIPDPIARQIEERVRRTGASLNKTVIDMLSERTIGRKRLPYHDLDHLVGTWTAEEADEFDRALAEQRKIEPELWK